VREPREAEREEDDVAGEKRGDGGREAPVPLPLGEPAGERRGDEEAHEVPAGRADHPVPSGFTAREDGRADEADDEVEREAREPADRAERRADEEDRERLARDRNGVEGDPDLGRERDERRAGDDEDGVREEAGAREDGEAKGRGVRVHGARSYRLPRLSSLR
jgi:hypothetical protein